MTCPRWSYHFLSWRYIGSTRPVADRNGGRAMEEFIGASPATWPWLASVSLVRPNTGAAATGVFGAIRPVELRERLYGWATCGAGSVNRRFLSPWWRPGGCQLV